MVMRITDPGDLTMECTEHNVGSYTWSILQKAQNSGTLPVPWGRRDGWGWELWVNQKALHKTTGFCQGLFIGKSFMEGATMEGRHQVWSQSEQWFTRKWQDAVEPIRGQKTRESHWGISNWCHSVLRRHWTQPVPQKLLNVKSIWATKMKCWVLGYFCTWWS